MKRVIANLKWPIALLPLWMWVVSPVQGQNTGDAHPYFYAIGDMPYEPDEVAKYEHLIRYINSTEPLFTVHVGDTKSGHVDCSNESYTVTRNYFNGFERPLMYTPGDNEWTDCHQKDCGGYLGAERLSFLRKTVYETPTESFGKTKIPLDNESRQKGYEKFVENSAWQRQGVMFCTVHICGSSNNYYSKAGKEEFSEREKADLFWLDHVFDRAAKDNLKAVVIFFHANMFHDEKNEGYVDVRQALVQHAEAFAKPVMLVYGDTHTYDISKPLHGHTGLLKNLTAVQVFGSPDIYAVRIFIDEASPDLFRMEPVYPD
jgi:hypothetical protein